MVLNSLVLGVWGALTVLALCGAVISLVLHYRSGSAAQLQSEVRQLAIDVEELFGAVDKWTKRRQVADARSKIGATAPQAVPERGSAEYKQFLRKRVRGEA